MDDLVNILTQKGIKVIFNCNICGASHEIEIPKHYFQNAKPPYSIIFHHTNPSKYINIFLNEKHEIVGWEDIKAINISENELGNLLKRNRGYTLKKLFISDVYGFKLIHKHQVVKQYLHSDFHNTISFHEIFKFFDDSKKWTQNTEDCSEFYMKYNDFWIGGAKLLNFEFFMIINPKIDIDHLKSQMMFTFELFARNVI